jgi:glycosyltransferase involved in cell wall biosynthesis
MISVLILTRNEAHDLPGCLDSVAWCDDIHLLDSGSTDATPEIARQRGATVTSRPFDDFCTQRNAGLALPFRYPWVLVLDADERPTPELSAEMQQAVALAAPGISAFRLSRRDFLWGTWLRHAQMTRLYLRLLRVGRAHYTRAINEVVHVEGSIADLHAPLLHLPFSKGISSWVARHNDYSTREAALLFQGEGVRDASLRQALLAPHLHQRRIAQKALFYRLPLRPLLKWLYLVCWRGAFLDGPAGMTVATLQAFYEYLIVLKCRELQRAASLPAAETPRKQHRGASQNERT